MKRRTIGLVGLALILSWAAGCQGAAARQAPAGQPAAAGATAEAPPATQPAPGAASARPLQPERPRVTVGDGSASGNGAAIWVAADRGYFKDHGLDAEIQYTRSVPGIQALIAGEIQFVYTGCAEVMESRRAGADLILIANTNPFNLYLIAGRPEITTAQQLVGKRVAVNQLNDTSHLSARFALKEAGVDPDAVTYLQVGSTPERFAALQAGAVEGALQAVTNLNEIKALGMNVLVNLFDRQVPYCGSGIGVSERFLRENPQTVEAFLRGFLRGNAYFREGDAETVKSVMAAHMKSAPTDPAVVGAYEYFAKQINPRYPVITRDGIAFILDQQAQTEPAWRDWRPEQFYDTRLMDKLQQEGYLDAVYQQLQ